MELGRAELRKFDLRSHARLHLAAVAEFAGAAVHMDAREGLDIVFIDAIWALSAVILSNLDVGCRIAACHFFISPGTRVHRRFGCIRAC